MADADGGWSESHSPPLELPLMRIATFWLSAIRYPLSASSGTVRTIQVAVRSASFASRGIAKS
jgi:hypothetical protein